MFNLPPVSGGYDVRDIFRTTEVESPCIAHYAQLRSSSETIADGYGEYLIYQKKEGSNALQVEEEMYNSIYEIIRQNPPASSCQNRSVFIREEIKKVDDSLDIIFIPRTIYELIFIEAAIREEVDSHRMCDLQEEHTYHRVRLNKELNGEEYQNCWHICRFEDPKVCEVGEVDYHNAEEDKVLLRKLAFRMNTLALSKLPSMQLLRGEQLGELTENGIAFLEQHRQTYHKIQFYSSGYYDGGAKNFGESSALKDEAHAQIVRNAVAVECSEDAKNATILYRGAREISYRHTKGSKISLSYGTGLFAGAFLDHGACVFYFSKSLKTAAFLVSNSEENSPFYIPNSHPIQQLLSVGEMFHARSLVSSSTSSDAHITGVFGSFRQNLTLLFSSLDEATLASKIRDYHSKAIYLSPREIYTDPRALAILSSFDN